MIRNACSFGITESQESAKLADTEMVLSKIRPYQVRTIENQAWHLDVVPEFNGRVIRMIDKKRGRDLLRSPALGEGRGIPNLGGWALSVYPDPYAPNWLVEWESEEPAVPDRLTLLGKVPNGLRLRRTFRLRQESVDVETEVENAGDEAVDFVIYTRADLAPVDIDSTLVTFHTQAGNSVEKRLIAAADPPAGNASWLGGEQPDGTWTISDSAGVTVWNRFDSAHTRRCFVNWSAKSHPRVSLGLWSTQQRLSPGEKFRTEGEFGAAGR